jgi:hypothetical protein
LEELLPRHVSRADVSRENKLIMSQEEFLLSHFRIGRKVPPDMYREDENPISFVGAPEVVR